jgi:hypothetical protein
MGMIQPETAPIAVLRTAFVYMQRTKGVAIAHFLQMHPQVYEAKLVKQNVNKHEYTILYSSLFSTISLLGPVNIALYFIRYI